ncbi:wax ester/triacylglycerol synthase domain-containing protein [Cryobacterium arcticum]|uniref:diacylglycerol O-acyltransferase n=1 Tax=Cryobacterium arcticum TaxID=670052 RepID=A0A317ZQS5_9MICO|nr:wax ester/triacylglycerol synthase domain-containing protein [Cryobacterium arcticum]PXA68218.1 hypothetical protein CTB96_16470 [Cryobacterium arcticum]
MRSRAPIDRASADDLMALVAENGSTPMQVGAVLLLDAAAGLDPRRAVEQLGRRAAAVPRLRQRLLTVPAGCGRPIWVDDPGFDVARHVSVLELPGERLPENLMLAQAAELLGTPLPRDRPLWVARLVTTATGRSAALVVVIHHVLADGVGGLAVLGALADGAAIGSLAADFPRPQPARRRIAADAMRLRARAMRELPGTLMRLVAAALHRLLATRGERLDEIVVSVPFSARQQTGAGQLGNASGVIPLRIPAVGDATTRLHRVTVLSRTARGSARGASTALLGPLFRLLARLGLYRRFINGQRRIHTFTSNVRGPAAPLTMFGCPVTALLPLSAPTGNVTVAFAVLSYAGTLAITLVADLDACPDLTTLRSLLVQELAGFAVPESPSPSQPAKNFQTDRDI